MKHSTVHQPFRLAAIGHVIDQAQRNQQCHWASDLVSKGLTPDEICKAIQRAMASCQRSGLDVGKHFQLKHVESEECSSYDNCRLSQYGYLLTVVNANPNNQYVALYQKQILKQYLLASNDLNIG